MNHTQYPQYRSRLIELLNDSPITRAKVIQDVRELIVVGEYDLAFDTLCEWIYEDDLPISTAYHARLQELADEMNAVELVQALLEQVKDPK
ncbi:hypothetical protein BWI15_07120 [Kribbella sp. ALI-6-A]|uniref:MafI family immunity protein n=1 Tax=Kribbella sp. ALI-6-A TaxID=1933817 RepID=UPI00097C5E7C|nr:MafI family immunity protein [Kribbella sp. ALI-6-A]ONI75604.1 hypothetical protein BWI15_07120 [Kribbella sp. ALI-6-A]